MLLAESQLNPLTRQGLHHSPCTTFLVNPRHSFFFAIHPNFPSWAYWSIPEIVMTVCIELMCFFLMLVPVSQSMYVALWIGGVTKRKPGVAVPILRLSSQAKDRTPLIPHRVQDCSLVFFWKYWLCTFLFLSLPPPRCGACDFLYFSSKWWIRTNFLTGICAFWSSYSRKDLKRSSPGHTQVTVKSLVLIYCNKLCVNKCAFTATTDFRLYN